MVLRRLIEIPVETRPIFDIVTWPLAGSFYADAIRRRYSPTKMQRRKTMDDERGEKEEPRKWWIPVIKSLVGRRTAG